MPARHGSCLRVRAMLETVIIGGGVCGLALAGDLLRSGRAIAVFEARARLGGRVLSVPVAGGALRVDLGPTWYWPRRDPSMVRLVAELGLETFAQHDTGSVLILDHPRDSARIAPVSSIHGGARRLVGGMGSLVEALAARLPRRCVHLEHALAAVVRSDEGLDLHFVHRGRVVVVRARRAVLTVPPRLIAEQVLFEPALDARRLEVMLDTPTWMAGQAKGVLVYDRATWRDAGHSGNAFVRHDRAVLSEIFDASGATGAVAALGGFVALPEALRRHFGPSLRSLMRLQVSVVFGQSLEEREHVYQDWATEPRTRSRRDLTESVPDPRDAVYGAPLLARSEWDHRLYFGGAETAVQGGGHLEGALQAARRLAVEVRTWT
jgi:monoamine oxidase